MTISLQSLQGKRLFQRIMKYLLYQNKVSGGRIYRPLWVSNFSVCFRIRHSDLNLVAWVCRFFDAIIVVLQAF